MHKLIAAILLAKETDREFPLQMAFAVAKDELSTPERLAGVEALAEGERALNEAERIIQTTGKNTVNGVPLCLARAFRGSLRDTDVLQF